MRLVHNLQALRAVAAAMVVGHHLRDLAGDGWPALRSVHIGAAGVDIFFVLSGLVIALSAGRTDEGAGRFLLRRLLRVAPMYWIVTGVVALMLAAGLSPLGIVTADASVTNLVRSLAFIPFEREGAGAMPLLGVGWTLNYEMFFYLLFAATLLLPVTARFPALVSAIAGLILAGLVLQPQQVAGRFYADPVMLEFAAGMALAQWWPDRRGRAGDAISGLLLIAFGAVWLLAVAWTGVFTEFGPLRIVFFGVPALAIVAGALLLEAAGRRLDGRVWMLLGASSYALYLSHPLVLQAVGKAGALAGLSLDRPLPWLAAAAVGVIAAHGVGAGLHLWVERPLTTRLMRLARDSRPILSPDSSMNVADADVRSPTGSPRRNARIATRQCPDDAGKFATVPFAAGAAPREG